jgi:hypothetical protein
LFALAMLGLNLAASLANGFVREDYRTLVGVPVAGAMIVYLLTPRGPSALPDLCGRD